MPPKADSRIQETDTVLRRAEATPQLKEWMDRLAPVVAEAREILRHRQPGKLTMLTGCELDANGSFRLPFFWEDYFVGAEDFTVRRARDGKIPSSFIQSLILTYMATADGTTPSRRWIGFRELPDGMFYVQAFRGYTGVRLVRQLGGGIDVFQRAAESLDSEPLEAIGDAGYAFAPLPRVAVAIVYWQGDDEFSSQARVLFEDTAVRYLPTDGLAIIGSHLVGCLLRAVQ